MSAGRARKDLFRDEHGITTVAMAVAIMVSVALMFTGAQAYRATSASSEVQEVADACAIAAEAEVSEFMVCVKVCDAAILSLGLLAGASYGVGLVCACVPPLASVSTTLVKAGSKALKARNEFAKTAQKGLNSLQKALPFLAAASAATVASANNSGAMGGDYVGCAVLLPKQGKKISIGAADALDDSAKEIRAGYKDVQKAARQAEKAAKQASEAKQEAFDLDCGNDPGYCQYERAGRFDWMPAEENPRYESVDAWSFKVALERAKAYYKYRLEREVEPVDSVKEKGNFHCRKRFYEYAYAKLSEEGYVNESDGRFDANFPELYKNNAAFKNTSLYATATFPVSRASEDAKGVMHAWPGCPSATGDLSYSTISALETGACTGCEICDFSMDSMGKVASASTNISNGFEYHYDRIRKQAETYKKALDEAAPLSDGVRDSVEPILETLADALKDLGSMRIDSCPCGADGAIAIVVNRASNSASEGFENLFVRGGATLGSRAAVSGAALVEDASDDTSDVISALLEGLSPDGGAAIGGAQVALDLWSGLLKAYGNGQESLKKALRDATSDLPLATLTGLGNWAADVLESVMEGVGLEPANLNALKPAILNTGHISSAGTDSLSVKYSKARATALSSSTSTGSVFGGLTNWVDSKADGLTESEVTIAKIEFPIGGATVPITVSMPESLAVWGNGLIGQGISALEAAISSPSSGRPWQ